MSDHYRVEQTADAQACPHCGEGAYWTIVKTQNGEDVELGAAWGDKEFAEDICDWMNAAFDEGRASLERTQITPELREIIQYRANDGFHFGDFSTYEAASAWRQLLHDILAATEPNHE